MCGIYFVGTLCIDVQKDLSQLEQKKPIFSRLKVAEKIPRKIVFFFLRCCKIMFLALSPFASVSDSYYTGVSHKTTKMPQNTGTKIVYVILGIPVCLLRNVTIFYWPNIFFLVKFLLDNRKFVGCVGLQFFHGAAES